MARRRLGVAARVEELVDGPPAATQEQLDEASRQAGHGGQRRVAELLASLVAGLRDEGAGAGDGGRPPGDRCRSPGPGQLPT